MCPRNARFSCISCCKTFTVVHSASGTIAHLSLPVGIMNLPMSVSMELRRSRRVIILRAGNNNEHHDEYEQYD